MTKKVSRPYSIRPRIFATPGVPFIDLGFYVPRDPGPGQRGWGMYGVIFIDSGGRHPHFGGRRAHFGGRTPKFGGRTLEKWSEKKVRISTI